MIAFCLHADKKDWTLNSKKNPDGILSVTFINGLLNLLRLLIENKKPLTLEYYNSRLGKIDFKKLSKYKSSHYREMGIEIYREYFID